MIEPLSAGDGYKFLVIARCNVIDECLGYFNWTQDVDVHHIIENVVVDAAENLIVAAAANAGIVDQYVDRLAFVFRRQGVDLGMIDNIQRFQFDIVEVAG